LSALSADASLAQAEEARKTVPVEPETRYAQSGDVSIAYQVMGDGPFDIVLVPAWASHLELAWRVPTMAALFKQFGSFARLIRFDKRGTGLSDRPAGVPTLEQRMDDLRAVMDAVGSSRTAIVGAGEGAPMSILFSATYPERTWALVLIGGIARTLWAPDYPAGRLEDEYRRGIEETRRWWGEPGRLEEVARLGGAAEEEVPYWAAYFRSGASPGAAEALYRMNAEIDVRHVLPTIRVPTLVLHRADDVLIHGQHGRYLAERIGGATYRELPGGYVGTRDDWNSTVIEVQRFLTGAWQSGGWEEVEPDRVLATVLFTDIVGASEKAVELGDRAWRELLERHHEQVRRELVRFRGKEVDTAGDGFFASFDGPARAIRCACTIVKLLSELGLQVRAGLHTGECELVEGKVTGIAVHTGARVAANAEPGEVLVSSTVKDLVAGSGLSFEERGVHELKGIPGEWRLYAVEG